MRTTLEISDDAYQIAKTVAREQRRSMGSVVSDFITGQFESRNPPVEEPEPFFKTFRSARRTTIEDVKALDDDE
jgi:hypothetical protein